MGECQSRKASWRRWSFLAPCTFFSSSVVLFALTVSPLPSLGAPLQALRWAPRHGHCCRGVLGLVGRQESLSPSCKVMAGRDLVPAF